MTSNPSRSVGLHRAGIPAGHAPPAAAGRIPRGRGRDLGGVRGSAPQCERWEPTRVGRLLLGRALHPCRDHTERRGAGRSRAAPTRARERATAARRLSPTRDGTKPFDVSATWRHRAPGPVHERPRCHAARPMRRRASMPGSLREAVTAGCACRTTTASSSRAEFPRMAGLHANYEIAENVTIDTAGVTNPDGSRTWNLSGPYSGDQTVFVTTDVPTGQWFTSQLPGRHLHHAAQPHVVAPRRLPGDTELARSAGRRLARERRRTDRDVVHADRRSSIGVPMKMGTSWSTTSNVTRQADGVISRTTTSSTAIDRRRIRHAHGPLRDVQRPACPDDPHPDRWSAL